MAKNLRMRISALGKDVTVQRLTTSEIRQRFYDTDTAIVIDLHSMVPNRAADETMQLTDDAIYYVEVARLVEMLYGTIADFEEKVLPLLMDLPADKLVAAFSELYRNAALVNPSLDRMASAITVAAEPLDDGLERLVDWLPSPISSSIADYLFRESYADMAYAAFEFNEAQRENVLEVQEGSVQLEAAPELDFDVTRVKSLRSELALRVVGQGHAIDHVVAVAKRIAVGFRDPLRPPAVMLFVGPTGVGKTLLAKVTAEQLFGRTTAFGRIDCATLSERHDVAKLFGPPPGYVGYPTDKNGDPKEADPSVLWKETRGFDKGGILLLDEIEKAHPDIWDAFLTIFDEGYAKTSVGNMIDFRNTIIVLTSNLGTRELSAARMKTPVGFSCFFGEGPKSGPADIAEIKATALQAAREYMKPELLGRLSAIVPFTDLDVEDMKKVVDIEWGKAREYVNGGRVVECGVSMDESVRERIAEVSASRGSGARLVSRLVEGYVIDPLAEFYVERDGDLFNNPDVDMHVVYAGMSDTDQVRIEIDGQDPFTYSVSATLGDDE